MRPVFVLLLVVGCGGPMTLSDLKPSQKRLYVTGVQMLGTPCVGSAPCDRQMAISVGFWTGADLDQSRRGLVELAEPLEADVNGVKMQVRQAQRYVSQTCTTEPWFGPRSTYECGAWVPSEFSIQMPAPEQAVVTIRDSSSASSITLDTAAFGAFRILDELPLSGQAIHLRYEPSTLTLPSAAALAPNEDPFGIVAFLAGKVVPGGCPLDPASTAADAIARCSEPLSGPGELRISWQTRVPPNISAPVECVTYDKDPGDLGVVAIRTEDRYTVSFH